jgi:hypothetical protein
MHHAFVDPVHARALQVVRLISRLMLFCYERKHCTMADKFKRTGFGQQMAGQ